MKANIKFKYIIPPSILAPNKYDLIVGLHRVNIEIIRELDAPVQFIVEETGTEFFQYADKDYGCVFVDCKWDKC